MAIDTPTKTELFTNLRAYLASRLPEIRITADSDIGVMHALFVEEVFGIYANVRAIEDDLFVSARTSREALEKHAFAKFGGSKGATKAIGSNAVQVTKEIGSVVSDGVVLAYSDGTRYAVTKGSSVASTTVTVSVEAIESGVIGNRQVGDELTFESAPDGVEATATVVAVIDGGEDAESDGALVARLQDVYRNPPATGRFSDWRQWATSVVGVDSAYVYGPSSVDIDGRRGLGAVDVAILSSGTGANRIPSTATQLLVEDAINDARAGAARDFIVLLPTTLSQNVDLKIDPEPNYSFDWTKDSAATVSSWAAGTKRLTWSRTIVAGEISAGDRLITNGEVNEVLTVGSNYTDMVDIFASDPTSAQIYEAGPLTEPVQAKITALFDALGPARGTAGDPLQDWDDTLRITKLHCAAFDVPGVRDVTVVTPASNVVPTDTGSAVQLLIPGTITVRPV